MTEKELEKLLEVERQRLHDLYDLYDHPSNLPDQILKQSEVLDQLIVAFLKKKSSAPLEG